MEKADQPMNWREERRLLNNWLQKKAPVSKAAEHIIHQKARTIRKRKRVQAVQKWRRIHGREYARQLKAAKVNRARKQQEPQSPLLTKRRAQHCAISNFFLCKKKNSFQPAK